MRVYECKEKIDADHLAGTHLDESHYDILAGGDEPCDVYKPDGEPLVKYRPGWFSEALCRSVLPSCRKAAAVTTNRGMAAGKIDPDEEVTEGSKPTTRYNAVKADGTVSNTNHAAPVNSGIIGYFNRTVRQPYCRQTSFVISQAASWKRFLPYIVRADEGFREFLPERWQSQKGYVARTPRDWVIPESTFTTVTVNRNFQTATHKDAGDLKSGFGVMSCLRNDRYEGAYLVFPAYRVAVNYSNGCLCLADVHEWHSNTPFRKMRAGYERITMVFYYREKMVNCKPAQEEAEWAKNRKRGEPITS